MLTVDDALRLVSVAIRMARDNGINVSSVVVDAAGRTLAQATMTESFLSTSVVAQKKAFTAVNFRQPTHVMLEKIQPIEYQTIVIGADPRLTFIKGGLPIVDGERSLIGGIGVSGGTGDQDLACCEAALAAMAHQ